MVKPIRKYRKKRTKKRTRRRRTRRRRTRRRRTRRRRGGKISQDSYRKFKHSDVSFGAFMKAKRLINAGTPPLKAYQEALKNKKITIKNLQDLKEYNDISKKAILANAEMMKLANNKK